MCSVSFPFVYFHNVPLHFMIPPPPLHAQPLFLLPGLDEHQVRGRNLRRGRSLSSEHICRPAAHMFTPDPSPVDVWAAPARSSLYIAFLAPASPTPTSKRFSFLLSRKTSPTPPPQPQKSHRVARCVTSTAEKPEGRATANPLSQR